MNLSQLSEAQQKRLERAVKNVPFNDLVGIQLESAAPGFAKMSLSAREELKQNNRVVHGGAIASLIDSAAACAVIPLLKENETTTTVDLTVSYLRPLSEGIAFASATVLREGSRLIVISVEVRDEAGNLAATGLTTYLRLSKR
jgi:uncharacterized protein (TIGR00369 family)